MSNLAAGAPNGRWQRVTLRANLLLCGVLLLVVVGAVLWNSKIRRDVERHSADACRSTAVDIAAGIDDQFRELEIVESIASELNDGTLTDDQVAGRLKQVLTQVPEIGSLSVAYRPEWVPAFFRTVADPDVYVLFALRTDQGVQITQSWYTVEQTQDTRRGDITKWYRRPLQEREPVWNDEVYFSPVTRKWWSGGYGVPFFRTRPKTGTREPAGVVYADVALEQMRQVVSSNVNEKLHRLPVEASYAFVVSASGVIVSHPDGAYVEQGRHIRDFDSRLASAADIRTKLTPPTRPDEPIWLLEDHHDEFSGQDSGVCFTPLRAPGWWVAVVLDKAEVYRSNHFFDLAENGSVGLMLAVLGFLFFLSLLVFRVDRGGVFRLWVCSISFALLGFAGIVVLWYLHAAVDPHRNPDDIVLVRTAIPQKIWLRQTLAQGYPPVVVPTGVFVQSVEFSSANNVTVTGYIWQEYRDDLPGWTRPEEGQAGVVFPESEDTQFTPAYSVHGDESELLGWSFKAVLRQEFDYSHYPFDREEVWVRMWHSRLGRGVMLIPDTSSYRTLVPNRLPGVEAQDFVLEGWDVERSYFSYRMNGYNSDFGIDDRFLAALEGRAGSSSSAHGPPGGRDEFPELYFNIGLRRSFVNPFIGNLIPLGVVAFLLFAVLLTIRLCSDSEGERLLGFSTSSVLGFCAALFFVVILAHTSLRESLASQQVVYLEYFYFVEYIAILGVAVNSLLVASSTTVRGVRYGNNLLARLLYWPVMAAALLVITLLTFA